MKKKIKYFDLLYYLLALAAIIFLLILFTNAITTLINLSVSQIGYAPLPLKFDVDELDDRVRQLASALNKDVNDIEQYNYCLSLINLNYVIVANEYVYGVYANISIPLVILEGVGIIYFLIGMFINFKNMSVTEAVFNKESLKTPGIKSLLTLNIIAGILRLKAKDENLKPEIE